MRIFVFIFIFSCQISFCQDIYDGYSERESINEGWTLKSAVPEDTMLLTGVSFPNTIHQILFQNKIIPDPYYGNNESKLKWVEECDWIAEKDFTDISDDYDLKFLVIEGIEPYAKVYINNKLIIESDNAFKKYSIDITSSLIPKQINKITIIFQSPVRNGKEIMTKNNITLPVDERIYTRKAQFEYGWDWGPRFVTTGIKKSIEIVHRNNNYFEVLNSYSTTKSFSKKEAIIETNFTIYSDTHRRIFYRSNLSGVNSKGETINLVRGINNFSATISIKNPELWWPNQMGRHPTYSFSYEFAEGKFKKSPKSSSIQTSINYAFCNIELIQQKDSIGESFYFKVNGVPFYAKGFNIIPEDHFGKEQYSLWGSTTVNNLVYTGSNIARVWGGGKYLSNQFYEECLNKGIIVWQDFMFACAMYPGDTVFLNNVKTEITQQVIRLRNYNNIAVWCGNNESNEAWKNWGWQKQFKYSKTDSTKIWNDYSKLFQELIPKTLKELIPIANYITTSPQIGWGHNESLTHGDSHYWGVWWGKEPISTFNKKIPRFMSEFGMQAMPDISTLKKVIADSVLNFNSPEFKNHQKHPTGFETLNHYLKEELFVPSNLEDYSYATQVLQSYTLKTAIEAQRRAKPRCMGSLIWQLNDVWPVTSWSVIDYYNQPKLAFYEMSTFFDQRLISVEEEIGGYKIYIVNDDTANFNDTLKMYIADFTGTKLWAKNMSVKIKGNSSSIYFHLDKSELRTFDLAKIFLHSTLGAASNNFHFVKLNQLKLPADSFDISISEKKLEELLFGKTRRKYFNYYTVELTAKTYMPYVQILKSEKISDLPTDFRTYISSFTNHILPGQKITFDIPKEFFKEGDDIKKVILEKFKSLNGLLMRN